MTDKASGWQPIETAPKGYSRETGFNYVLFRGVSKSNAFNHPVYISGYMGVDNDGKRHPVHFYHYKLQITHWMPLPDPPK